MIFLGHVRYLENFFVIISFNANWKIFDLRDVSCNPLNGPSKICLPGFQSAVGTVKILGMSFV